MTRLAPLLLASALVLPWAGCGDEACSDLFGSAGQGKDLSFDAVQIRLIGGETLTVTYKKGAERPAIFSARLTGATLRDGFSAVLGPRAGDAPLVYEGNVERAANDGQDFGPLESGSLRLDTWGSDAEGSVGARFEDGRSLNGAFCGPAERLDL